MTGEALTLALVAAVLHASWNTLVKLDRDRFVFMANLNFCAGLIALSVIPFVPVPTRESWPYLATSVLVHQLYMIFLLQGYRYGDLSQVYPIARGAAPIFVLGLALVFAGEVPTAVETGGILLITGGVMALTLGPRGMPGNRPAVLFAFGTAAMISIYTVVDGIGARISGSAHSYAVYLFVFDSLPLFFYLWIKRPRDVVAGLKRSWHLAILAGAVSLTAYWLVIWALSLNPMGAVSAVRETSVVIAAAIGSILLKEGYITRRMLAAGLVAVGIIVLGTG